MLDWALKEWDVAVTALLQGQTLVLLRKGGLRENQGQFTLPARQVLLLPTLEHQTTTLLKPDYQAQLSPEPPPANRDRLVFKGWAEITHWFTLPSEAAALALLPGLIWNRAFVQERWQWQPDRPLYGLILRPYRLATPYSLPWHAHYGGCRSWIALKTPVDPAESVPVWAAAPYQAEVDRILAALPALVTVHQGE